jgi:hypothetical protein
VLTSSRLLPAWQLPSSCAAVAVIDASISGTPKEVFAAQEEKEVDGKLVYPPPPLVIEQVSQKPRLPSLCGAASKLPRYCL